MLVAQSIRCMQGWQAGVEGSMARMAHSPVECPRCAVHAACQHCNKKQRVYHCVTLSPAQAAVAPGAAGQLALHSTWTVPAGGWCQTTQKPAPPVADHNLVAPLNGEHRSYHAPQCSTACQRALPSTCPGKSHQHNEPSSHNWAGWLGLSSPRGAPRTQQGAHTPGVLPGHCHSIPKVRQR